MPLQALNVKGVPVDSQVGITPLFVRLEPAVFQIVGTGFYIARYGSFLTAKHVVDEITDHDAKGHPAVVWIWKDDGTPSFRAIITCSFYNQAPRDAADIAICQAVDCAKLGSIRVAQANERIGLVTQLPAPGTVIATYAYPNNHRVDFSAPQRVGKVVADSFEGRVLEVVGPQSRFLRYEHVETSVQIRGGASGGPVFASGGHAFAVNCRGWDLGAGDAVEPLSSVVPVSMVLDLEFKYPAIPPESWEHLAVPENRRGGLVTLRDLATWGHISVDPQSS